MIQFITQMLPMLVVLGAAIIILVISSFYRRINGEILLVLAVAGLSASIWFAWQGWLGKIPSFDLLALIGFILFALSAGMAVIAAYNYITERKLPWGEFLSLVLFAVFGAGVMASSKNLIAIFIGLETLSISAYVLAGYNKGEAVSNEAAIKYFTLGATASAVLLFGIAFFYGATGALDVSGSALNVSNPTMLLLAVSLIIAGFGFKIAAVPFQWWTPDVYQGSPLPVTTFFATAVKAAAFIAFFRVFVAVAGMSYANFVPLVATIAIATMTFANLAALFQEDIKRMLAYSSIAHAGYILLAFVFIKQDAGAAQSAMLFYLLAYIMMTTGAFAVLIYNSNPPFSKGGVGGLEKTTLSNFSGLGRRNPWLALAFTAFLFSLAGFPPTAGFFAKFYLFKSAVQHGYVTLVIIAVLNSLVSVYYYMRPVVVMYFGQSAEPTNQRTNEPTNYSVIGIIIFSLIAVAALGLFPSSILQILVR